MRTIFIFNSRRIQHNIHFFFCADSDLRRVWPATSLTHAEFDWRRVWLAPSLTGAEFDSRRVWLAPSLTRAEFDTRRVWLAPSLTCAEFDLRQVCCAEFVVPKCPAPILLRRNVVNRWNLVLFSFLLKQHYLILQLKMTLEKLSKHSASLSSISLALISNHLCFSYQDTNKQEISVHGWAIFFSSYKNCNMQVDLLLLNIFKQKLMNFAASEKHW